MASSLQGAVLEIVEELVEGLDVRICEWIFFLKLNCVGGHFVLLTRRKVA